MKKVCHEIKFDTYITYIIIYIYIIYIYIALKEVQYKILDLKCQLQMSHFLPTYKDVQTALKQLLYNFIIHEAFIADTIEHIHFAHFYPRKRSLLKI